MNIIAGVGRKRPLLNVSIDNLYLDPQNPRLPEDIQGKGQEDICYALYRFFDIEELAFSMAENGYFDEEPLVAIPEDLPKHLEELDYEEMLNNEEYTAFIHNPNTNFIVVEGNRRLSTIKILLDSELRNKLKIRTFPEISVAVRDDISLLPVIIYPTRKEVLPYLGVRHITGIKKWEPYAKARYIAKMVDQGFSIEEIQQQVGDRSNSARKIYLCYQLIEVAKYEFDLDTEKAENFFSYLLLASGQGAVKDYLGLEKRLQNIDLESPIPEEKLENLKNLFSWLFGEGKDVRPVIQESRDITSKLSPVLRRPEATEYLKLTRNLEEAYERSDGEEELLMRNIVKASRLLSQSLSYINENNAGNIVAEVNKIQSTIDTIKLIMKSKSE